MRTRAEELLEDPYEELVCTTFHSFCVRLLQEEALEAGFDPFFHPAAPADRLALMMERLTPSTCAITTCAATRRRSWRR